MPAAIGIALAGGMASGVLYAAAVLGTLGAFILALLAQLPLFLVGLWMGSATAGLAGLAAAVSVALFAGLAPAANFVLVNAVPVAFAVHLALLSRTGEDGATEWYPPGRLVTWLAIYAAALFLAATVYFSGGEGGLEALLRDLLKAVARRWTGGAPGAEEVEAAFVSLARMMPAMAVASWLMVLAVNGALAQGLLLRFGRNLRPTPEISTLTVPRWLAGIVAGAAVLGLIGPGSLGFAGQNLAIILALPYFFAGLGVLHTWIGRTGAGIFPLVLLYAFLLMLVLTVSLVAILLVAGTGLIDQYLNLRGPRKGRS